MIRATLAMAALAWACAPAMTVKAQATDAEALRWEAMAPLPIGVRAAAAAVGNGVIYVVGGDSGAGVTGLLQILDLESGRWSIGESLPTPAAWGTAVWFDDRLHFLGGVTEQVAASQQHWIYDPAEDAWSRGRPLPIPAAGAAIAATDSRIFVLGGIDGPQWASDNVLIFDREADRWSVGEAVPGPRTGWAGAMVDGRILAAGGGTRPGRSVARELLYYDTDGDAWGTLEPLAEPRESLGAAAIGQRFCVVGGKRPGGRNQVLLADASCYDVGQGTWSRLPDLAHPRHEVAVVASGDDLYALGGRDAESHPVTDAGRLRVPRTSANP